MSVAAALSSNRQEKTERTADRLRRYHRRHLGHGPKLSGQIPSRNRLLCSHRQYPPQRHRF